MASCTSSFNVESKFFFEDDIQEYLRWSERVPPHSALTFAVIVDDNLDRVGFSGAKFLRPSQLGDVVDLADSPSDITDDDEDDDDDSRSEIIPESLSSETSDDSLTSSHLSLRSTTYWLDTNSAALAFFQENYSFLFSIPSPLVLHDLNDLHQRPESSPRTQASSTVDGVDVYLRGSMAPKSHHNNRYYSCFDALDAPFDFDPRTSFQNRWVHIYGDQFTTDRDHFSASPNPTIRHRRTDSRRLPLDESEQGESDDWRWTFVQTPMRNPRAKAVLRYKTQIEAQRRRLRKPRPGGSAFVDIATSAGAWSLLWG